MIYGDDLQRQCLIVKYGHLRERFHQRKNRFQHGSSPLWTQGKTQFSRIVSFRVYRATREFTLCLVYFWGHKISLHQSSFTQWWSCETFFQRKFSSCGCLAEEKIYFFVVQRLLSPTSGREIHHYVRSFWETRFIHSMMELLSCSCPN